MVDAKRELIDPLGMRMIGKGQVDWWSEVMVAITSLNVFWLERCTENALDSCWLPFSLTMRGAN